MFVNGSGQNVHSLERIAHRCFLPSFGSFGQTVSEEKNFKYQNIRNKSRLWRSCLLTDRDEMSNLYRGTSIDASYQVSVHLAKRFQRRRFLKNRPIRNKNCLWRPCLLMNQDEMSNLYFSIDASLSSFSSFGWGFSEEKIKMWKVNGQQTTDAKWWQKLILPLKKKDKDKQWSTIHYTEN
jgi:hypothetical protein